MLNQLVESKNHDAENARKNSFLVTTLGVLVAVLVSGWTYSLFAKNYGMGTGDFELAGVTAPVIPAEEPPAPEPETKQPEKAQTVNNNERPTLIEKNVRMEDSLNNPPKLEDSRPIKSTPLRPSELKDFDEGTENKYRRSNSDRDETGDGLNKSNASNNENQTKVPEVVVKPKPVAAPEVKKQEVITRSGGVMNGKAINLVKPSYPPAARAMNVKGAVTVQVLIDEKGNVLSAAAASGHPLLRTAAEQAARQTKFSPTYLTGQPIRVTGVIVYNFQ
jgi:protein TonB